jgi:hypothetical protein
VTSLQAHATNWKNGESTSFLNWSSRVAIAGRIAEYRRSENYCEMTISSSCHLPFGKAQAQARAAKWPLLSYLI